MSTPDSLLETHDTQAASSARSSLPGLSGAVAGAALRPLGVGIRLGRDLGDAVGRRASEATLATVDAVLASALTAEIVERVLASDLARRAVEDVLAGPVESALDSEAMERLVVRVIEGDLLNEAVERLLKTEELWLLVDEIAHSPSVTDAIAGQSISFVDEVADGVRARSRGADSWIESRVRRALGRRQRAESNGGGMPA